MNSLLLRHRALKSKNPNAFTLIELIVVIVIIGILAAVAAVAYNSFITSAEESATESSASQIGNIVATATILEQKTLADFTDADFQSYQGDLDQAGVVTAVRTPADGGTLVSYPNTYSPASTGISGTDPQIAVCSEDLTYCLYAALPDTVGEAPDFSTRGSGSGSGSGNGSGSGGAFDTDGDGFTDTLEEAHGSDPNNSGSTPIGTDADGDGSPYEAELIAGTNPLDASSVPTAAEDVTFIPDADFSNPATGTYTEDGVNYKYVTFSGSGTLVVTQEGAADILAVGPGQTANANGNGGIVAYSKILLAPGSYPVNIGYSETSQGIGNATTTRLGNITGAGETQGAGNRGNGGLSPNSSGVVLSITGTPREYGAAGSRKALLPSAEDRYGIGGDPVLSNRAGSGVVIVRVKTD